MRFTPGQYPATLNSTRMILGSASGGVKVWGVDVYADNGGGAPGTAVCSFNTGLNFPGAGAYTLDIDLTACDGGSPYTINSGDFYIAFRQVNANDPQMGIESNAPISGRAWDFNGVTWSAQNTRDYHIAAVLAEAATSQDRVNNVVGIDLDTPATGTYTLTVTGHNIPQGPQPYALTVSGIGRLLGTESVTMPIDGAGTYIFGNTGVSMTFSSEDIDTVTVEVFRDTVPTSNMGDQVTDRLYRLSSAGGSGTYNTDISFYYETAELNGLIAADLNLYRNDGGVMWQEFTGTVDEINHTVTITGVTAFSDWATGTATPTSVLMAQQGTSTQSSVGSVLMLSALLLLVGTGYVVWRRRTA